MNDSAPRHPEAQSMAAFLEGKLPPEQLRDVADHLRGCSDCRTVVAETARFEREEERLAEESRPRRPWTAWLAVAAVLAVVAVSAPILLQRAASRRSPVARLIAAAPREHRSVEARLSGFAWAPLQTLRGTSALHSPADRKLDGAANDVLADTETRRDVDARHAAGIAHLLLGERRESLAALEQASRDSKDAKVWNDLAAARYAAREDDASQLPDALADAKRALQLDPKNAEALFNYALIVEAIGQRIEARKAWQRYLDADPNSGWSAEAREHLRKLGAQSSRRFDPSAPAEELVREFPRETRLWCETTLLADRSNLGRARAVADALAARAGEHLLDDAVRADETCSGAACAALADGHRLFAEASATLPKDPAAAETQFRRAAGAFARGGSAMSGEASYFAAVAAFRQNRDVHDELTALAARTDATRHRALAGEVNSLLALNANRAADFGAAVRYADAASATFRNLGERANAAVAESIAAYALAVIGAEHDAWTRRADALSYFCDGADLTRCDVLLDESATTLEMIGRKDAALALAELRVDDPAAKPADAAMTLAKHVRVLAAAGDGDSLRPLLAEARRQAERMTGAEQRTLVEAQIAIEEAVLDSRRSLGAALDALDRAVASLADNKITHLLPYAYLQRARVRLAAGDRDDAARDYAAALQATAVQQKFIKDPSLRLTLFDTAREAVDESIALELSRGAAAAAFAIADRRHVIGEPSTPAIGPDVAVVEYAVLPRSLVIFCLAGGQLSEEQIAVSRRELAERAGGFADAIRRRADIAEIRRDGAALDRLLIAPLRPRLGGVRELVIVPDQELYAVPFAALSDGNHFLIEDYTIRIAPAASGSPASPNAATQPALVVADPHAPGAAPLRAARDEAMQIAAMHSATVLAGDEATPERFAQAAAKSALIHYAGHANSDATTSYGALLLAGRVMSAGEVARLPLGQHPLVVLAACGTFRGDPVHVAGMSSLARAFLIAGARGVVGTLWEIDDEASAPLFLRFHDLLRAGASPARALRDAQLGMLRSAGGRVAHPAAWSPVELLQPVS